MRASINGTELFYEAHGEGPPVLLLHGGMGLDHTYFRPELDRLGEVARLIYYDQRGNGRSAEPAEWSSVGNGTWVEDAEALRAELGLERMVLLGHSYGGCLAQEYALRYPDRLAGLILCSTAPAFDHAEAALANARERGGDDELRALETALSTPAPDDEIVERLWRGVLPLYFEEPDPAVLDQVASRIRYRAGAWNRSLFDLLPGFDVRGRLRQISVPTLVIGGRGDWIMPPEQGAERIHRCLPESDLAILDACGHFPWLERPETFLEIVRDWLARLPRHDLP